MEYKRFFYKAMASIMVIFLIIAAGVIYVDPQFHYHAPIEGLAYRIYEQRYQNNGILRHFDYNAIITGTSMTKGFKATEMDRLFGTKSVKVPFYSASFNEINRELQRAVKENDGIKIIVRSIDMNGIFQDKDAISYDSYPDYLYDDNYFNDVEYVLNNYTIFEYGLQNTVLHTMRGGKTTAFDDYSNWSKNDKFGKSEVLKKYKRKQNKKDSTGGLTWEEKERIKGNAEQNVLQIARNNPHIQFYCFITPYSVVYYDMHDRSGNLEKRLEGVEYAAELLVGQENIHLFSFGDKYDVVTNLDNYFDAIHYSGKINSQMLEWMSKGEGRLTKDNYKEHFDKINEFYLNYNYDSIFE